MKPLLLAFAGCVFLLLGIAGLALPFLPGLLFLLFAAICFASLSPALRRHMDRHPRMARFFNRVDAGAHLDLPSRIKLAFWASLEAVTPKRNTNWHRRSISE